MPSKLSSVLPPVVKTVTVDCKPEEAFRCFTADFDKWWPLATHSCIAFSSDHKEVPESCVFQQHCGGLISERGRSGEEHIWGTVLVWEPPSCVAFSFHPMRDEKTAQMVEVRFLPVGTGTKVVLTHSGWENAGENAPQERDDYSQGWESVFVKSYARYANRP